MIRAATTLKTAVLKGAAPLKAAALTSRAATKAHPWWTRIAGATIATAAVTAAAPSLMPAYTTGVALVVGAATGAVISGGYIAHRRVAELLGSVTAVAALASACGIVLFLLALAMPHCPGGVGGRCTSGELGSWLTVGELIPVAVGALLIGPVILFRIIRMLYRFFGRNRGTARAQMSLRWMFWTRNTPEAVRQKATPADYRDKRKVRRRLARVARRINRRHR